MTDLHMNKGNERQSPERMLEYINLGARTKQTSLKHWMWARFPIYLGSAI